MDKFAARKEKKQLIGILGGTFDPIHLGHLILANTAKEKLKLDKVIFIPAKIPPHKDKHSVLNENLRYKMVELAIKDNQDFILSGVEIKKNGISYSVETLRILKRDYPQAEFYFIVGSDASGELKSWKNIDEVLKLCKFVMAVRPNFIINSQSRFAAKIKQLKGEFLPICSTDIRKKIKKGESVRYLIPDRVYQFIKKNNLYKKSIL